MAIGLSRPALVAMGEGYPVNFVFPADGSQIYDNSMALVKGAKHPNLAKEFMNYILGDEMQLKGTEYLYIPVKQGVIDPSLPYSLESAASGIGTIYSPDPALAEKKQNPSSGKIWRVYQNKGYEIKEY